MLKSPKKLIGILVPLIFLGIVLLATSQDYLSSLLLHQGFYISESLLFKLIWVFFIPMVFLIIPPVNHFFAAKKDVLVFFLTIPLSLVHLLVSATIMAFIAQNAMQLPFSFQRISNYLLAHNFFLVWVVYLLILLVLKYLFHQRIKSKADVEITAPKSITIRQGKKLIPIPFEHIIWIKSASPYIAIRTDEKKYLQHTSLKKILQQLNPQVFVRVHRSTIVNRHRIKELHSRSNGDYDLIMEDGSVLRWSRNYAQDLKTSLRSSS